MLRGWRSPSITTHGTMRRLAEHHDMASARRAQKLSHFRESVTAWPPVRTDLVTLYIVEYNLVTISTHEHRRVYVAQAGIIAQQHHRQQQRQCADAKSTVSTEKLLDAQQRPTQHHQQPRSYGHQHGRHTLSLHADTSHFQPPQQRPSSCRSYGMSCALHSQASSRKAASCRAKPTLAPLPVSHGTASSRIPRSQRQTPRSPAHRWAYYADDDADAGPCRYHKQPLIAERFRCIQQAVPASSGAFSRRLCSIADLRPGSSSPSRIVTFNRILGTDTLVHSGTRECSAKDTFQCRQPRAPSCRHQHHQHHQATSGRGHGSPGGHLFLFISSTSITGQRLLQIYFLAQVDPDNKDLATLAYNHQHHRSLASSGLRSLHQHRRHVTYPQPPFQAGPPLQESHHRSSGSPPLSLLT
ncbi:hypothetical protein TSAR_010274 [Trichomalopsis sarcophagae]|uniref:Uncharacterized protein n=1 Tax=Trichomalopsis sarcophagae TaxID=543379 RepID=A0A232EQL7_9HYME|nr:hypothetical protein TSAR_010274 [Trichomalopsis sarcophagae]